MEFRIEVSILIFNYNCGAIIVPVKIGGPQCFSTSSVKGKKKYGCKAIESEWPLWIRDLDAINELGCGQENGQANPNPNLSWWT